MPPMPLPLRAFCAAIVTCLLAAVPASAQVAYTWTGLGSDAHWNTAGNWSSSSPITNPPPASDLNNTFLVLTGTTQTTNTLNYDLSANSLSFDSAAGPFVINGTNTLTIGSGGIGVTSNNNQTINANLAS